MSISSSNIGRFSKFFHWQIRRKMCNKVANKYPTTPTSVATIPCEIYIFKNDYNHNKYLCENFSYKKLIFLLKLNLYLARYMLSPVRLLPSVTQVDHSKNS